MMQNSDSGLHSKTLMKLAKLQEDGGGSNLIFVDEQAQVKLENVAVKLSLFIRLGLRDSIIKGTSLEQSIFEGCYFRRAKLTNVSFVGSSFNNCNFEGAEIRSCDFKYARFHRCLMPADEIISNMPTEPNLRRELARELRANAISVGRTDDADKFLLQEINADIGYHKEIVKSETTYFREKHGSLLDRFGSLVRLIRLWIGTKVWGNGTKLGNLIRTVILTLAISTILNLVLDAQYIQANEVSPERLSWVDAIYVSVSSMVSISNLGYVPISAWARILSLLNSVMGLVFLGLFVATVYRRISR